MTQAFRCNFNFADLSGNTMTDNRFLNASFIGSHSFDMDVIVNSGGRFDCVVIQSSHNR